MSPICVQLSEEKERKNKNSLYFFGKYIVIIDNISSIFKRSNSFFTIFINERLNGLIKF